MAKLTLEFEGDKAIIDAGIAALAREYGWQEPTEETPEAERLTQLEAARRVMSQYVRGVALKFAEIDAIEAAKAAAKEQTTAALDAVSLNVGSLEE